MPPTVFPNEAEDEPDAAETAPNGPKQPQSATTPAEDPPPLPNEAQEEATAAATEADAAEAERQVAKAEKEKLAKIIPKSQFAHRPAALRRLRDEVRARAPARARAPLA